jgi:hypothetical protein
VVTNNIFVKQYQVSNVRSANTSEESTAQLPLYCCTCRKLNSRQFCSCRQLLAKLWYLKTIVRIVLSCHITDDCEVITAYFHKKNVLRYTTILGRTRFVVNYPFIRDTCVLLERDSTTRFFISIFSLSCST